MYLEWNWSGWRLYVILQNAHIFQTNDAVVAMSNDCKKLIVLP